MGGHACKVPRDIPDTELLPRTALVELQHDAQVQTELRDLLSFARPLHLTSDCEEPSLFHSADTDNDSSDMNHDSSDEHMNLGTYSAAEKLSLVGSKLSNILPLNANDSSQGPTYDMIASCALDIPIQGMEENTWQLNWLSVNHVLDPLKIPEALMYAYLSRNLMPKASEIVMCSSSVCMEELSCWLARFQLAAPDVPSLYCLANVQLLDKAIQFVLLERLQEMKHQHTATNKSSSTSCSQILLLVSGREDATLFKDLVDHVHRLKLHASQWEGVTKRLLKETLWPRVQTFVSPHPGTGKTERVRSAAFSLAKNLRTMHVCGNVTSSGFIASLREVVLNDDDEVLHLDITSVHNPCDLNNILFEFFILRLIRSSEVFYCVKVQDVLIEISNSCVPINLVDCLPVCSWFKVVDVPFRINDLVVSKEICSPVQIVCNYLRLFEAGLQADNIVFDTNDAHSNCVMGEVMDEEECIQLLTIYYMTPGSAREHFRPSFSTLHVFINVLAAQLIRLSKSIYFRKDVLESDAECDAARIKGVFITALLQVARDFASRSVSAVLKSQETELTNGYAKAVAERFESLVEWSSSNHLMLSFNSDGVSISILYKQRDQVDQEFFKLLRSQTRDGRYTPTDYQALTHTQLLDKLVSLACITHEVAGTLPDYVLSLDNFLKMTLIMLRIRARVPVIVMGETGCGKTSLISFLAAVAGVPFFCLNVHAGTTEEDIISFVEMVEGEAAEREVWAFLDEINTCEHLGLISNLICNKRILHRRVSGNATFCAACNPYRLRRGAMLTPGLNTKAQYDMMSALVYRVHPLPECLVDYVMDFGSLNPTDEELYIDKMCASVRVCNQQRLVQALIMSQAFIKEHHSSASLRDVRRAIKLVKWFKEQLESRNGSMSYSQKSTTADLEIRACIAAFAICYRARLTSAELRHEYTDRLAKILVTNSDWFRHSGRGVVAHDILNDVVRKEQEYFVNGMDLSHHEGTALNQALLENVFVLLVCILNKLPVFLVGKPGCSKSLAMQLIRENMRGPDSKSPIFKRLPQIMVVSFQGSDSSTSEGIKQVFEKAHRYAKQGEKDVIPVVLLDEVGLAEISPHNPLKILHSLLEPASGDMDVAIVGISNWALDEAKMNRAIHLSRPDLSQHDLVDTAQALWNACLPNDAPAWRNACHNAMASFFFTYYASQAKVESRADFFGLRDFYSFVKDFCRSVGANKTSMTDKKERHVALIRCLCKNFGGLKQETDNIRTHFYQHFELTPLDGSTAFSSLDLIRSNLDDPNARHLMVISDGNHALDILQHLLRTKDSEFILGSCFSDDQSADYSYRVLSRIILSMEMPHRVVVLQDLDAIQGSLMDPLNQNYVRIGSKRNCRVALGASSNPMCQVGEGFRFIVLCDQRRVETADRAFISRFDKHVIDYADVMSPTQQKLVEALHLWTVSMAAQASDATFTAKDLFVGFDQWTLHSLVLSVTSSETCHATVEEMEVCKQYLIRIASLEGMMRVDTSRMALVDRGEVDKWKEYHKTIRCDDWIAHLADEISSTQSAISKVIMTYTGLHWNPQDALHALPAKISRRFERLDTISSEVMLADRISRWENDSDCQLLVLQCDAQRHCNVLPQTMSTLAHRMKALRQKGSRNKHVVVLLHMPRMMSDARPREEFEVKDSAGKWEQGGVYSCTFSKDWAHVMIDSLESDMHNDKHFLLAPCSISELFHGCQSEYAHFDPFCSEIVISSLKRINFKNSSHLIVQQHLKDLSTFFQSDDSRTLKQLVLSRMSDDLASPEHAKGWQQRVLCDRAALILCSTIYYALWRHVCECMSASLARVLSFLDDCCALDSYVVGGSSSAYASHGCMREVDSSIHARMREFWVKVLTRADMVQQALNKHKVSTSYECSNYIPRLQFPFSRLIFQNIEALSSTLIAEANKHSDSEHLECDDEDLNEILASRTKIFTNTCEVVRSRVTILQDTHFITFKDEYIADLLRIKYAICRDVPDLEGSQAPKPSLCLGFFAKVLHSLGTCETVVHAHCICIQHKGLLDALETLLSCNWAPFGGVARLLADINIKADTPQTSTALLLQQLVAATCKLALPNQADINKWSVACDSDIDVPGPISKVVAWKDRTYPILSSANEIVYQAKSTIMWPEAFEVPGAFHTWRICDDLAATIMRFKPAADGDLTAESSAYAMLCSYKQCVQDGLDFTDWALFQKLNSMVRKVASVADRVSIDMRRFWWTTIVRYVSRASGLVTAAFNSDDDSSARKILAEIWTQICTEFDQGTFVDVSHVMHEVLLELLLQADAVSHQAQDRTSLSFFEDISNLTRIRDWSKVSGYHGFSLQVLAYSCMCMAHAQTMDTPFFVMICDIFTEDMRAFHHLFQQGEEEKEDIQRHCLVPLIRVAASVLTAEMPVHPLVTLCTVAFVRVLSSHVGWMIRQPSDGLSALTDDVLVAYKDLLVSSAPCRIQLLKHIKRPEVLLREHESAFARDNNTGTWAHGDAQQQRIQASTTRALSWEDLRSVCESIQMRNLLSELPWSVSGSVTALGFDHLCGLEGYKQLSQAFDALLNGNKKALQACMATCASSRPWRVSLASVVIGRVYLKRARRDLNHDEKKAVHFIRECVNNNAFRSKVPQEYVGLLNMMLKTDNPSPPAGLRVQGGDPEEMFHMVSHMLHLGAVLLSVGHTDTSLFGILMRNAHATRDLYIPSVASSEMSQVLSAVLQETTRSNASHPGATRYKCRHCEYIYFVVDCGNFQQAGRCPDCKAEIGTAASKSHRLDERPLAQVGDEEDLVGYLACNPASLDVRSTVRQLPAPAFRVLHLLVHMSVWVGELLGLTRGVSDLLQNAHNDTLDNYLREHVERGTDVLCTNMHVSTEDWSVLMHALIQRLDTCTFTRGTCLSIDTLSTAQGRLAWEDAFRRNVYDPVFANPAVHIAARKVALQEFRDNQRCLEVEIDEGVREMDEAYHRSHMPVLFRRISPLTTDRLCFEAEQNQIAETHPLLALFFRKHQSLEHVHYLRDLVAFSNLVADRINLQLSRTSSMTFAQFIDSQSDAQYVQDKFLRFEQAWNAVRASVTRYECTDLPPAAMKIQASSPVRCACIDTHGESVILLAMITDLANRQNALLDEVLVLSSDPSFRLSAASFVRNHKVRGVAGLRDVHVQYACSKDLIGTRHDDAAYCGVVSYAASLTRFAHHDLGYARGNVVQFDWSKMEKDVIQEVFFGKLLLNTDVAQWRKFVFSGELFHSGSERTIEDIRRFIPQRALSAEMMAEIQASHEITHNCSQCTDAISTIMFVLKNQIGGYSAIDPEMPLLSLRSDVPSTAFENAVARLKSTPISSQYVQLQHVVSVFEAVEDKGFDVVFDRLKNKDPLPADLRQSFEQMFTFIREEALFWALRRFIVRKLAVADVNQDHPLMEYLQNADLWPTNSILNMGRPGFMQLDDVLDRHFPKLTRIANTASIYLFLQARREDARSRDQGQVNRGPVAATTARTRLRHVPQGKT